MLEYICFCYYCKICYPTYFLVQDPSIFPFSFLFVILFFPLSVLHSLSSLCLTLHWQSSCSAHQVLGQAGTWLAAKKLALALWSEKFILLHLYTAPPWDWCPLTRTCHQTLSNSVCVEHQHEFFSMCRTDKMDCEIGSRSMHNPTRPSLATLIKTRPATWEAGLVEQKCTSCIWRLVLTEFFVEMPHEESTATLIGTLADLKGSSQVNSRCQ